MRRVFNSFVRGAAAVSVIVLLSTAVAAAPRERNKEKVPTIHKLLRIVRSLGDGIVIPLPAPKP
ncbi:MAG TPA: hypothetical protein VF266_11235 [Thermoanaerobaculia bacterium]